MASIGALLDHLVRERAVNELEDDGIWGLEVRAIEMLSLWVAPFVRLPLIVPNLSYYPGTKRCRSMQMPCCQCPKNVLWRYLMNF